MPFIAAAGAIGSIAGGIMGAENDRKQGNMNRDATKQANLLSLAQEVMARGGDATSILQAAGLPAELAQTWMGTVMPAYAGKEGETALYNRALATSNAITATPNDQALANYRAAIAGQMPAIEAGNQFIGDMYSGALEQQRLANLDPVNQARLAMAQSQQGAIDLTMRDTINRMAADEARKGYVGAGNFGTNRMAQAMLQARQQAAGAVGGANLQNALARQALQESGVDLRLKGLDLAPKRAEQMVDLSMLPEASLAKREALAQQPLNFFKLTPGNVSTPKSYIQNATPDALSSGLSAAGQQLGGLAGYLQYNKMANQANQANQQYQFQNNPAAQEDLAYFDYQNSGQGF